MGPFTQEYKLTQTSWRARWCYVSKALKMYIIFDSAILPLGVYLQEIMMDVF